MIDLSFQTAEVYSIIGALAVSVILFIYSNKLLLRQIKSFEFNFNYFLLGVILALLSAFVCFNWETEALKEYVIIEEEMIAEATIPVTKWNPEKRKLPPPPEKVVKETQKVDEVFVIKKVEKIELEITPDMVEPEIENQTFDFDSMMTTTKAEPVLTIEESDEEEIVVIAEQMPRFPGCEDLELNSKDKYACSKKTLMEYIYSELDYPRIALENGIEGLVVLQFVVDKDGSIKDITVKRDIGGGCGRAAEKVVKNMNKLDDRWNPGRQRGKPVKVLFTLPVKFKIDK